MAKKAKRIPAVAVPKKRPMGTPGAQACACLPLGSGPGVWVWDGFNPAFLPKPSGVGRWRLVWDSEHGFTWEAVN